jgi:putative ABC transport system ATP-binding protein
MIEAKNIMHKYQNDIVLHDINLSIPNGSFTVLSGESGSGKSTLLSILSSLLKPTEGNIYFDGMDINKVAKIDTFRNKEIGFIFQFHYLIAHLTVYQNIAMVTHKSKTDIEHLLETLDIKELSNKFPDEISGGQRQRAAIARAIINNPKYIFADEPTGNLDSKNSNNIFSLLRNLDATVIIATHDKQRILQTDQIITLKDGKIC